jgi:hypothetical protein
MSEYYHQKNTETDIYWDILEDIIRSGKLTIYSTPTEIKAVVGHEARRYGLSDEEIETAITYAFDNISALNQR